MKKKSFVNISSLAECRGFFALKNHASCKIKLKNKMLSQ